MKKMILNALSLNKETIALLDAKQLQEVKGGTNVVGTPSSSSGSGGGSTGCGSGSSQCRVAVGG